MKTTLTVLSVLLLAFLIYYRERIYVHDPLATVYRNEVQQDGIEIYINYSNDVLLYQDAEPAPRRVLLQEWNRMPGTPLILSCLRWIACMTDNDKVSTVPLVWTGSSGPAANPGSRHADKGKYDPKVFMTGHEVTFTDSDGSAMRIELR